MDSGPNGGRINKHDGGKTSLFMPEDVTMEWPWSGVVSVEANNGSVCSNTGDLETRNRETCRRKLQLEGIRTSRLIGLTVLLLGEVIDLISWKLFYVKWIYQYHGKVSLC